MYTDIVSKVTVRGSALINFWGFQGRRLFEVGAHTKMDAYSNKYVKKEQIKETSVTCKMRKVT